METIVTLSMHFKLPALTEKTNGIGLEAAIKSLLPISPVLAPNPTLSKEGCGRSRTTNHRACEIQGHKVSSNPSPGYTPIGPSMPLLFLIVSFSFISQHKKRFNIKK